MAARGTTDPTGDGVLSLLHEPHWPPGQGSTASEVQVYPLGQSAGDAQPAIGSHIPFATVAPPLQAGPIQRHAGRSTHDACDAPTQPQSVGASRCQEPSGQVAVSVPFASHGAG